MQNLEQIKLKTMLNIFFINALVQKNYRINFYKNHFNIFQTSKQNGNLQRLKTTNLIQKQIIETKKTKLFT